MGNVDSLYQPRNVHNEKSAKENTPKARKEKSHAKTQRRKEKTNSRERAQKTQKTRTAAERRYAQIRVNCRSNSIACRFDQYQEGKRRR
jgi:hypothetical protein